VSADRQACKQSMQQLQQARRTLSAAAASTLRRALQQLLNVDREILPSSMYAA
jgi:hypothetical protein